MRRLWTEEEKFKWLSCSTGSVERWGVANDWNWLRESGAISRRASCISSDYSLSGGHVLHAEGLKEAWSITVHKQIPENSVTFSKGDRRELIRVWIRSMVWLCENIELWDLRYDTLPMLDAPWNVLQLCARQDNNIGLTWDIHCSNKEMMCISLWCKKRNRPSVPKQSLNKIDEL